MTPDGQGSLLWDMTMNQGEEDAVHPVQRLHAQLGFTDNAANQKMPLLSEPTRPNNSNRRRTSASNQGRARQRPVQQKPMQQKPAQQNTQDQEVRTWFANVFQKFYGAGVGQPGGYQYTVAQDPETRLRQIRVFQDPNDAARSFVFVEQPNGLWELRSGTGQVIMGNVHYDPKLRRFFALGVSEADILNALRQSGAGQQSQKNPDAGKSDTLPSGVTASFPLGDGSVFTVSVDGMARVLRSLGNNQWAVVMERPLQELLNLQQPAAGSAQSGAEAQPSEQIPSWMLLLLTLFLLMGRR